jgi:DNA-binding winged helix-turn-helix (wHTH) protein/predicted ATPase
MSPTRPAESLPVRIDAENETAWCGERRLELTPRAFSVLRHLVEHPHRLITKDDLLTTVWRDAIVSDAALASCIRDLRKALGDSSEAPRYIETVHRRGFRFIGAIAALTSGLSAQRSTFPESSAEIRRSSGTAEVAPTLVGREAELARLHACLERARSGQRQLVLVTGEPGIGKTALVEAFLAQIGGDGKVRIGRGQCVEQYGAGEPYLPVLEALGRLGREAGGEQIVQILKQYAPTWLMQLPSLLEDRDLEAVQQRAQAATRDRMLRELVEALDALSLEEPLILVLEDLHWSDSSTIDLLARLARRREAARLLVLGTYRPADVAASAHPLRPVKQELEVHGHCEEMPLEFLDVPAVRDYLALRFPRHHFPSDLAPVLHENTGGNPLFVVNTIDDLIAQGRMREVGGTWGLSVPVKDVAAGAPETLSQMVDRQVERLTPDEQAMLAVASVAGVEFSAAIAAADAIDPREGERRCDALARRGQLLRATGVAEWPDGTVAGRYAFIHALYQHVLYARVPITRRVGLHLRTGERLERAYGLRVGEIAGELAVHFEHGRDIERAVQYRRQAAENALRQHAYHEAADHARQALHVLAALPGAPGRVQQELTLQVTLGTALTAMKGYSAPEVERAYARALELCGQADDTPPLFPVLLGLGWFYLVRGPSRAARDVGRRLMTLAEATRDPAVLVAAHNGLGLVSFYEGEFEAARAHLEQGIERYDPKEHSPNRSLGFRGGLDPGLSCTCHAAWTLWVLGYPARAAARMHEALALARSLDHPFTLAHACRFAAAFHLSCGERDAGREQTDATLALSTEHGFRSFLAVARFHRGWLLAEEGREEEGLALMLEWVAVCREIRGECMMPTYLAWLAEMHGKTGRPAEGLILVSEALSVATQSGYQYWTAELHRLKGVLTLQSGPERVTAKPGPRQRRPAHAGDRSTAPGALAEGNAEACFLEALEVARGQRAKSLELRAATSLSRLWARQGKTNAAHALLAETYGWFTEGLDTADLREAKSLLDCLRPGA